DGEELLNAIENERRNSAPRSSRVYTLLGPNRPWRTLLAQHRATGLAATILLVLSAVLSLLLVGHLAALILSLLARYRPTLRRWTVGTVLPSPFGEIRALYNRYNHRHVKVVGYNNGVNHFGHRFPGKTVVSTVHCDRIVRDGPDVLKVDCGATVRQA